MNILIIFAALCYLVSVLNFNGPLTFKQLIIDILALIGIGLFILCLFHVSILLPNCFGVRI